MIKKPGICYPFTMAKGIRLALLASLVMGFYACSAKKIPEQDPAEKKERALWQIIEHKAKGAEKFDYEDDWFLYKADFKYIGDGPRFTNAVFGQCPIESAEYTVMDKATKQVVREETLTQKSCRPCHPYAK